MPFQSHVDQVHVHKHAAGCPEHESEKETGQGGGGIEQEKYLIVYCGRLATLPSLMFLFFLLSNLIRIKIIP